jgi:hypothetical protein
MKQDNKTEKLKKKIKDQQWQIDYLEDLVRWREEAIDALKSTERYQVSLYRLFEKMVTEMKIARLNNDEKEYMVYREVILIISKFIHDEDIYIPLMQNKKQYGR